MVLDLDAPSCQREHVVIVQTITSALGNGRPCAACRFPAGGVDQAHFLASELPPYDCAIPLRQRRLEHDPGIRNDRALHDDFAEPIRTRDGYHVTKARFHIEREEHARAALVRPYHRHDADRERNLQLVVSEPRAVADGPIREQRREAPVNRMQQSLASADIEKRFGGAGEGRFG